NARIEVAVKRVSDPSIASDTDGGFAGYHSINLPPTGTWAKVVLNAHQYHTEGVDDATDTGVRLHPTNEPDYNYFDALSRFTVKADAPSRYPATYLVDGMRFVTEDAPEPDDQIYSVAGTYDPTQNLVIVTWNHRK